MTARVQFVTRALSVLWAVWLLIVTVAYLAQYREFVAAMIAALR